MSCFSLRTLREREVHAASAARKRKSTLQAPRDRNQFKDRIRVRFEKDKGEILDLVIRYEAMIYGKWAAIVRYDCAHGFFHRDLLHPNGDKEKKQ